MLPDRTRSTIRGSRENPCQARHSRSQSWPCADRIDWGKTDRFATTPRLRIYAILFELHGLSGQGLAARTIKRFDPLFPSKSRPLNAELVQLLVYLEAPGIAGKTLKLMAEALTQEEQLDYALASRPGNRLDAGRCKEYFTWYSKAAHYKGGASLRAFLSLMREDAVATLTDREKREFQPILEAKPPARRRSWTSRGPS